MPSNTLTGYQVLHGQSDRQDGHQCLVGHGVNDSSHNALHIKSTRNPAIQLAVSWMEGI